MLEKLRIVFTRNTMRTAMLEYMYLNKKLFFCILAILFLLVSFVLSDQFIILSIIFLFICYAINKNTIEDFLKYYKDYYRPIMKKKYTISYLTIEGQGGGLMILHPKKEQYVRWKSIDKIIYSKNFLFLIIKNSINPIILPLRYLSTEQEDFIKKMIKTST